MAYNKVSLVCGFASISRTPPRNESHTNLENTENRETMEEKKIESIEEEEIVVQEANKPPKVAPAETKPVCKTEIASRIDGALQAAKHVNRSADLVPLSHDFDQMRKQLKNLIKSSMKYQYAMAELDKARMDVRYLKLPRRLLC